MKKITKDNTISFRLDKELRKEIINHIKVYNFKNISEFITYSIEKELYKR